MKKYTSAVIRNQEAIDFARLPCLNLTDFQETIGKMLENGLRIGSLFAVTRPNSGVNLVAVLLYPQSRRLYLLRTEDTQIWPSMTSQWPQIERFEREMAEQAGIEITGHPHLTPLRYQHHPAGKGQAGPIGSHTFLAAEGEEIHEVAVGPVHAGIIEPGHFRFLCHGESILHLEISFGYQHRGIENNLRGCEFGLRSQRLAEVIAGDTSIGHCLAHCQVVEALAGCEAPPRAQVIRAIALELERLANHTGDLGAMAGDIGYAPTASFCGRLRGDFLNLTAALCGNRYGRGLVKPGGVAFDFDDTPAADIKQRLLTTFADTKQAADLLWNTPSVLARFEETGVIDRNQAERLGLVGPAARASGLEIDVRVDFPFGAYRNFPMPLSTWFTGDVFARAYVRWLEIQRSVHFIETCLNNLPEGPVDAPIQKPAQNALAVSLVEGWRGEICHTVITDAKGRCAHYKIVDPSFHNWMALAQAVRGEGIMDFPICNKSFSLSYCGHDL